jgi:hypothetical protein
MNKRRLLKLAELLEADAKNPAGIKFDMGEWGWISDPENPVSCGTTACAMGLAALSGAFKRTGLKYEMPGYFRMEITMPGARDGIASAMKLFEISRAEAEYLFADQAGIGRRGELKEARCIRKFVERGGMPKRRQALDVW